MTNSDLESTIGREGLFALRMQDGDVRIRAVDGDAIRISDHRGRDLAESFVIETGDGSVSLSTTTARFAGLRRGGHSPDLKIALPRDATIVIETTSADVKVDGLAGTQRYRTMSGDLTLNQASGRIAIDVVSGDVKVVAIGEIYVALRTLSGDVALQAGTIRSLRATTTSGDLKVAGRLIGPGPFGIETVSGDALVAPAGDVTIEMTTVSGDLRSEFESRPLGGRRDRSLSIGTGGPLLTFRSMSGDLRVVRPTRVDAPGKPPAILPPAPSADDPSISILRALELGEIDVAEAARRLERLDDGEPVDPASDTTRVPVVGRTDA